MFVNATSSGELKFFDDFFVCCLYLRCSRLSDAEFTTVAFLAASRLSAAEADALLAALTLTLAPIFANYGRKKIIKGRDFSSLKSLCCRTFDRTILLRY